jgi:ribose-phosphate pyrophosphokinase
MDKFPEDKFDHEEFVVVSPDVGSVARARAFAAKVHMGLAIVDKRRQKANECEVMNVIGDVKGKTCILYDDMVDTAGSLCNAANALVAVGGAKAVYACATHGVLSGPAFDRIQNSVIQEMVFHNTIPVPTDCPCDKIKTLDVAPIFARCIEHIHDGTSIADLF